MIDYSEWYIIPLFKGLSAIVFFRQTYLFTCLIALSLMPQVGIAQVTVNATIKPLQLIAMAITDGQTIPGLILEPSQGSHHDSLKPSGRRKLANSEVLLWVGPSLESSLINVIRQTSSRVITIQDLDKINLEYLDNNIDPHLWLSPDNAVVIAEALVDELSNIDSQNRDLYLGNLEQFRESMNELVNEIKEGLVRKNKSGFGVYHNAFQYYEKQFGLEHQVSFTNDESVQPGIRTRLNAKQALIEGNITCLLVEPGLNVAQISNLIDDENMKYLRIDVMGNDIPLDKNAYAALLSKIKNTIEECLP